ncbi:NAD-dependent epimerase/dehydratase family protein [Actinomadura rayongensis]|uniref:NAD-dependent epimerase/dehydratase family protein n=2 Tax=Actinomadura rayongensis TaxID=1429076 RepID=A0A6I4W3D0_9ACTN|nr:SDR family oxidoreductase [Actinomadura rayongensis]MXQ63190.1 NAD-dependent epimerase/dehydratase family protein [Actinomadura rayongensis]
MRVLVTGATGWIGSALVPELLGAGHQVVGLARSDASAAALAEAGAEVRRGSLDDLDVLGEAAADSDGVVHLAFKHDVAFAQGDFLAATAADRRAVETIGAALAGSDRPFAIASGTTGVAAPGRVATEADGLGTFPLVPEGPRARQATALYTLSLAGTGVRSSVVRLAPTTHGDGDHGFLATLIAVAREKGFAGYVGDGANRWPAGHRLDAARLFRLALEKAPAGSVLHANADEGVPLREIAEVIGRHLGVPARSVSPEDAPAHFGWLAAFVGSDVPASSAATRKLLGWEPTQPGLLEDLDKGHYFGA